MRNESAEDFLQLLKEWEKLCKRYNVGDIERKTPMRSRSSGEKKQVNSQADDSSDDELEVSRLVDICYGDPSKTGKHSLYLKVINLISVNFWLFFLPDKTLVFLKYVCRYIYIYLVAYLFFDMVIFMSLSSD